MTFLSRLLVTKCRIQYGEMEEKYIRIEVILGEDCNVYIMSHLCPEAVPEANKKRHSSFAY